MKVLRLVSLFVVFALIGVSSAFAQDGNWQVDLNAGAVMPLGSGDHVGDLVGPQAKSLDLKQRPGLNFGASVGHLPDDAWGFQVRGSYFRTAATDINEVFDAGSLVQEWGVNPDIKLACSGKSDCNNGPNTARASGSESRMRLNFLAVRSFGDGDTRVRPFVGLAYLGQERTRDLGGRWPNTILDIPSGIVINEVLDISTTASTSLHALGVTGGVSFEQRLSDSFVLALHGQVAVFSGSASNAGGFTQTKDGTLSNGLGSFTCPAALCTPHPLDLSAKVHPVEIDLGVSLRYVLNDCNQLGFGVGFVSMSGLPSAEYVVPAGRAAVFGGWQTGTVSESHVRLYGQYVVRF